MKSMMVSVVAYLTLGAATAMPLGNVVVDQEIQGAKISIPMALDLDATTDHGSLELRVGVDADLSSLQKNFARLAGAYQLPSDNCPSYGQHVVASLKGISLDAQGTQAVVQAKAHVAAWDCQKGLPGGGTTVKWENKCTRILGKRICTKVPTTVTIKPGPDIKNKLIEDDVDASVALTVTSKDGISVEIVPSSPEIKLHNDITRFANAIATMFGNGANQMARKQIVDVVDAGVLKKAIPQEFLKYNPKISSISFYTRADGSLGLRGTFQSVLSGEQLNEFLKDALSD